VADLLVPLTSFIDENQIIVLLAEILLFFFLNFILIFSLYYIRKTNYSLYFIKNININAYILVYFFIFFLSLNFYINSIYIITVEYFAFFIKSTIIGFVIIMFLFLRKSTITLLNYEFILLLNIIVFSLLLLLFTKNFIILLIILELYTYSSYILITAKTNSLLSTEGGLKYFILNSLSSGIIIIGICIIY